MEDQPFISPVQFLREPETRRRLASGSSPYFQNPSSSSSFSSGEKPLNLEKNFPSSRRHTLNDYSPNYIKEPPEILSSQTPLIQSSISSLVNSSYTPRAPPLFHSNSLSRSFSSTPRYQTPLSPNRFSVELIEEQSDSEDEDYPLDQHGSNFKKEETILTPLSLNPENIEKQRAFMEAYEEVHEIIENNVKEKEDEMKLASAKLKEKQKEIVEKKKVQLSKINEIETKHLEKVEEEIQNYSKKEEERLKKELNRFFVELTKYENTLLQLIEQTKKREKEKEEEENKKKQTSQTKQQSIPEPQQQSIPPKPQSQQQLSPKTQSLGSSLDIETLSFISPSAKKEYFQYKAEHEKLRSKLNLDTNNRFLVDPQYAQKSKDIYKDVNRRVSQIANDKDSILGRLKDIEQIIFNAKSLGEPLYSYTIFLLCTKFVENAEICRSSCYALANVAVALCTKFNELKVYLFYHFYESCPFCLPHYPQKSPSGESNGSYLARLGYKMKSGTQVAETEEAYMERMKGILSMFAAMTTIECPKNVIGIQTAWTWCARFLNLPPSLMSGQILRTFLEIAGLDLLKKYPNQFPKILSITQNEFFKSLPSLPSADYSNFKTYLETNLKTSTFRTKSDQIADWVVKDLNWFNFDWR